MECSLFYNHHAIGDVLIVIINPILKMTHYDKKDDLVIIYHHDEIIGYNIFNISKMIKIYHKGLIPSHFKPLMDIINSILKNHQLTTIEYASDEYLVGEVIKVKNHIADVNINDNTIKCYCEYDDVDVCDLVVLLKKDRIYFDGFINEINIDNINYSIAKNSQLGIKGNATYKVEDKTLINTNLFKGEFK